MSAGKKIFQYIDPDTDLDDNTRWIAADTEADADASAKTRGWKSWGGEILSGRNHGHDVPKLLAMGCDVIVN